MDIQQNPLYESFIEALPEPEVDPYAAIYVRISLDQGNGEMALDRQEQECRLCAFRGGVLISDDMIYRDLSVSAADRHKTREQYNRLLGDIEKGLVRTVYVWDLDRLTRQPDQLGKWITFAEDGICHIVEVRGMKYDLRIPGDVMNARIRVAVAEHESRHKGERQMAAARQRAQLGLIQPQGVRPIGYKRDGSIFPEEARIVHAIYMAFNEGAGAKTIARALSGEDTGDERVSDIPCIPRPSHTLALEYNERHKNDPSFKPHEVPDPQPWNARGVTRILRNARYAGFSTYGNRKEVAATRRQSGRNAETRADTRVRDLRTGEWVLGQWEPIVSVSDWERAQERLNDPERRTSFSNKRKHLGCGLFICSECGEPVHLHGKAYNCKGHVMRNWALIDPYVEEVIAQVLALPDLEKLVCVQREEDAVMLDQLRSVATYQRKRLEQAEKDYASGDIRAADLRRTRDYVEGKLNKVNRRIAEITKRRDGAPLLKKVSCEAAFREADIETKRAVIDLLCEVTLTPSNGGRRRRKDGTRPVYNVTEAVRFRWKTAAVPPNG